jgi:hypothetical protein
MTSAVTEKKMANVNTTAARPWGTRKATSGALEMLPGLVGRAVPLPFDGGPPAFIAVLRFHRKANRKRP